MCTRKLIVLLVLILIPALNSTVFAGTPVGTFTVINHGNVSDTQPYETAIANADMEAYRYQNRRSVITFDNGVQIELLSATEMQQLGHAIILADYKTDDLPGWIAPVFHLNADGTLSAMFTKPNLKQSTQVTH